MTEAGRLGKQDDVRSLATDDVPQSAARGREQRSERRDGSGCQLVERLDVLAGAHDEPALKARPAVGKAPVLIEVDPLADRERLYIGLQVADVAGGAVQASSRSGLAVDRDSQRVADFSHPGAGRYEHAMDGTGLLGFDRFPGEEARAARARGRDPVHGARLPRAAPMALPAPTTACCVLCCCSTPSTQCRSECVESVRRPRY